MIRVRSSREYQSLQPCFLVVVTLSPGIKRQAIAVGLQQLSINSAFHQSWNIQINSNMMEVPARQLQAPQLNYRNAKGQPQIVNTNDGGWMTKGLKAWRSGVKVSRWIVVVFAVSLTSSSVYYHRPLQY